MDTPNRFGQTIFRTFGPAYSARLFFGLSFLMAFALGLPLVSPGLAAGDSGELVTAAYQLGIPHPPGYPLWTLIAHLLGLLPLGSPAFRVSLLSLGCWALATSVLGAVLTRRWGSGSGSVAIGYGLSFFIAFGPLCLAQATGPEVYGLHYLLSSLLLASMCEPTLVGFWSSGLIFGLGFAHHHTLALVVPAWAWVYRKSLVVPLEAVRVLVYGLLGASLYLVLPLRASQHPLTLDWGHPDHWRTFYSQLMRHQYGGDWTGGGLSNGFWHLMGFMRQFVHEGWGASVLLLLVGLWFLKNGLKRDLPWYLALAGTAVVFPLLVHTTPNPMNIRVNEVFFPPVMLWAAPLFLSALKRLDPMGSRPFQRRAAVGVLVLFLGLRLGPVFQEQRGVPDIGVDRMGYDFLLNLPRGSVLYSIGDDVTFPLAYLQGVLDLRKDTDLYDQTGGCFKDIYHCLDSDPPRVLRDLERVRVEEALEKVGPVRPVFYATGSNAPGRNLYDQGLLYRVVPLGESWREPKELWSRFRVPPVDPKGDYMSRDVAAFFFVRRVADRIRAGAGWDEIVPDLRIADALGPDNAALVYNISVELMDAGRPENARNGFLHALEIDPTFVLAWYNLGILSLREGDTVEAERYMRRSLGLQPNLKIARDVLAQLEPLNRVQTGPKNP